MKDLLSRAFRKQRITTVVNDAAIAHSQGKGLKKVLGVRDLVSFGISSTLGSGIFVTVGSISALAGPGLFLSFLIAAFGSLLSACCYAEFASRLPVSGQSYTYTYVALGEVVAFTTGWLGFVAYSVATAAVARGWATYFDSLVALVTGSHLPAFLVNDPVSGFGDIFSFSALAAFLNIFCVVLACVGIQESTRLSFILVVVNFVLMTAFCMYGATMYAEAGNLEPLLPFGLAGVVKGSGLAFFCCIGWELVCTLAEEVKHPSRDLPRGIVGSLSAVTVLYCAVCLTLSAMVPFELISVGAPIADAFSQHGDRIGALLVSVTVVIVCIPSTLTGIVGTPRIVYKMAQDGLVYRWLGSVNSHGAPVTATIVSGTISALMGGVLHFDSLASSCSAVTLFMFAIVCVGVVIVRVSEHESPTHPHAIQRLTFALIMFSVISLAVSMCVVDPDLVSSLALYVLAGANIVCGGVVLYIYEWALDYAPLAQPLLTDEITVTSVPKRAKKDIYLCPLVPIVPLIATWVDIFMMASLGYTALTGVLIMLLSGMAIYFSYGINHSKLDLM